MAKKGRLSLTLEFLAFQLERQMLSVIEEKNCKAVRGSLKIENIRVFDERLH